MKYLLTLCLLCLISCQHREKNNLAEIVSKWKGKEVKFPLTSVFTKYACDTVVMNRELDFKLVVYVDSTGCTSCKLQLHKWKELLSELDSIASDKISYLFYVCPKNKREFEHILKRDKFDYPVCVDQSDSFNKLNHFSSDPRFQVFLLDKENKVIAVGNPVDNPKMKELYLNVITGSTEFTESTKQPNTTVLISDNLVNMGDFSWKKKQEKVVTISNTGNVPLVISDVITSCGCITVEYNKEPTQPGKIISIQMVYLAEHPEYFNKTITIYCNTKDAPLQLKINGNAK